jgi:acetyl-CoA C-acetyltransferase
MVADPVNLFDSAPDADGAAAIVITRTEGAQDLVPQPIIIAGSSVSTDKFMLQERDDILKLEAVRLSTEHALQQANTSLSDIDLAELHDSFTIMTTLALEASGLANRGEGWKMATDTAIGRNGSIPISTFGGLKSRGNPAGATGIYQAVEACLQLRGIAGDNQIELAKTAMIQNIGGIGSTVATHILSIR